MSSTDDTNEEKQITKYFETRRTTKTNIIDEQRVAGNRNTSNIGATNVDDNDNDGTHAIAVVLTENKNDEHEFKENDDDGGPTAAVLLLDNTDDEDTLKENRRREQAEDRNIHSGWRQDGKWNHPCFRYPTREELDGAEQHFKPFIDEVCHKEERKKWEIVKKKETT